MPTTSTATATTYHASDVLSTEITGALLVLLQSYHDRWDKDHSLRYTLEDCLLAGVQAKKRSKEYSAATENRKRFEREIAANPAIVMDPAAMIKLCRKYGIGASSDATIQKFGELEEEIETAPAPTAQAATGTNG